MNQLTTVEAEEALSLIQSGYRVFIQGGAATPVFLIQKLLERKAPISNVELVSISLQGIEILPEDLAGRFFVNSLFVSKAVRKVVNSPLGDYVPVFLSEIPGLFRKAVLPLDVAIVQVSPPDSKGFCSLGPSVDIARSAVDTAKFIIAQVNPKMPRTHGDSYIHVSKISAACYHEANLQEIPQENESNELADKIGKHVAELVEDGATLQMGIGFIPDAVLSNLGHLKNLGIHTEMFSDGVIPLMEKGVINNSCKKVQRGISTTSFALGSSKLYEYIHDHPNINFLDIAFVNNPIIIAKNPKVTAINSAIEIDLTGQVCADSIGSYQYSGIGGQMDFIRGAALSVGGKPIIAMPSVTGKGVSKIVPFLKEGAGVVTTRGHIHWVVTEYGAVNLFGKNLRERAKLLIEIAHPSHRESLERTALDRFGY